MGQGVCMSWQVMVLVYLLGVVALCADASTPESVSDYCYHYRYSYCYESLVEGDALILAHGSLTECLLDALLLLMLYL